MTTLLLDLETIRCPAMGAPATDDFPPPPWHRIVCAGFLRWDRGPKELGFLAPFDDEHATCVRWSAELDDGPTVCTFNGRAFDLEVLAARCMHHGIPLRAYYAKGREEHEYRKRYDPEASFDLADYLGNYGAIRGVRFTDWARLIGLPGKRGVDGSKVQALYDAGEREAIEHYCLEDVCGLAFLWLRTSLARGIAKLDQYRAAAQRLWDFIAADPRVAGMLADADRARVLLAEPAPLVIQDALALGGT